MLDVTIILSSRKVTRFCAGHITPAFGPGRDIFRRILTNEYIHKRVISVGELGNSVTQRMVEGAWWGSLVWRRQN